MNIFSLPFFFQISIVKMSCYQTIPLLTVHVWVFLRKWGKETWDYLVQILRSPEADAAGVSLQSGTLLMEGKPEEVGTEGHQENSTKKHLKIYRFM